MRNILFNFTLGWMTSFGYLAINVEYAPHSFPTSSEVTPQIVVLISSSVCKIFLHLFTLDFFPLWFY